MSTDERHSATRRIAAPADRIFAIVTDPQGHVSIDGSGMLVAPADAAPMREVGDAFIMHMDREPLGDIPLGKYDVENRCTRIEDGRLVEWSVGAPERSPLGHVYGWELTPVGDETDVTNYCDWSGLNPKLRDKVTFPVVPIEMLEASLDRLAEVVAED
jgi:uncharacterized protein YndB with AHSA1/START domain